MALASSPEFRQHDPAARAVRRDSIGLLRVWLATLGIFGLAASIAITTVAVFMFIMLAHPGC